MIAITVTWLGILVYNAIFFFKVDYILCICCLAFEALALLYSGVLSVASFTSLYERFHWQLHLVWAFMLTGVSILTTFRDFENYKLDVHRMPIDYTVRHIS
jgi:hypothetical protein